jgi:hypothetical protein
MVLHRPSEPAPLMGKFAVKLIKKKGATRSIMRIDQPRRCKAWHKRSSPENGWVSRPEIHLLRSVSGQTLRRVKTSGWHCCILTTSGHSHLLLKITKISVRFQKRMRLVSLEIPEPDATEYQNLMRQNTKLTRSRATKSTLRTKCRTIGWKAARTSGAGSQGGDRCRESRDSGVKLCAGCDDRPLAQNA